jgi:hypothetical protein
MANELVATTTWLTLLVGVGAIITHIDLYFPAL